MLQDKSESESGVRVKRSCMFSSFGVGMKFGVGFGVEKIQEPESKSGIGVRRSDYLFIFRVEVWVA